uniref:Uncharacterized protein n=1 Tax=viral metagenome TaxID=1070528 RepID=A0A6C0HM55_9ZZZZ
MKNFNNSIKEKEQKILDFYKTIRELSGNSKLAKTVVRKRTKKNLYLEKEKEKAKEKQEKKDIQEKHDTDDHDYKDYKDKLQKGGAIDEDMAHKYTKQDANNTNKNNFVVWD